MLFVITGPSGCGKSTLVKRVLEEVEDVDFSVSHTTRKKRDSEKEGKDYYFIAQEEFKKMIKMDKLAEWAVVHGHCYGTSRREIEKKGAEKDILLDIDVQGAQQIKARFKKAIFVFILPPGFQELKLRLKKRGDESEAMIRKRLEVARKEIRSYPEFDYIIINDKLDKAVEDLAAVIISARCRLESLQREIMPILRSFSPDEGN